MQWCEQLNVHCADSPSGDFTYIPSVNGSYKFLKQNLEWLVAGLACRKLHKDAHLLVINDEQEQLAVARFLSGLSVTFLYYISFYCQKCDYVYLSVCLSLCMFVCLSVERVIQNDFERLWPKVKISRGQKVKIQGFRAINRTCPKFAALGNLG